MVRCQRALVFLMAAVLLAGAAGADDLQLLANGPGADPNVLFDLSIEWPTSGAAYNDGDSGSGTNCTGRAPNEGSDNIGSCYQPTFAYLGYFDGAKCYQYDSSNGWFKPNGAANATDHSCTGSKWSGNFLNWAAMTAVDEFRQALTGGNRGVDTSSVTVLQRSNVDVSYGSLAGGNVFPIKKIGTTTAPNNVSPGTVTPYSNSKIYVYNHNLQLDVGSTPGGHDLAQNLNARVKVCDAGSGLESNCVSYATSNKPVGLIQQDSSKMRFGVMSYLLDTSQSRDGGVLRAKMAYVGPVMKDATGSLVPNPSPEWSSADGTFFQNPDPADAASSGVANSGAINYINKFGMNGNVTPDGHQLKSYDPIGEIFYEAIRYYKHESPTPEYSSGLTTVMKDSFPVITSWNDPIQYSCQKNFIVGINDANPWLDKRLPGTAFKTATIPKPGGGTTALIANDFGEPSNPDLGIKAFSDDGDSGVAAWTDRVGDLEGLTGTSQNVGGDDSGLTGQGFDNNAGNPKKIVRLGHEMGTYPYAGKQNSYFIAGLAFYANTEDLRSDFDGNQTVATFLVDTQEFTTGGRLLGNMNMLWLAAKYGGFVDSNNNGVPDVSTEWDADGDGVPDNYVLASNPQKMVGGLNRAFNDILRRNQPNSFAAASVPTVQSQANQIAFLASFFPAEMRTIWSGHLRGYLIDPSTGLPPVDAATLIARQDSPDNANIDPSNPTGNSRRPLWDAARVLGYTNPYTALNPGDAPTAVTPSVTPWPGRKLVYSVTNAGQVPDTRVDFTDNVTETHWGNLKGFLGIAGNPQAQDLIDFLRGDRDTMLKKDVFPDLNGSPPDARSYNYQDPAEYVGATVVPAYLHKLGDVFHSDPAILAGPQNFAYFSTDLHGYATAFAAKHAKRRRVLFVGSDDGFVHGFDAGVWGRDNARFPSTWDAGTGREIFGYAPRAALASVKNTFVGFATSAPYTYTVDGGPALGDVFTDDQFNGNPNPANRRWHTLLVGGLRQGGNSVYALDVTQADLYQADGTIAGSADAAPACLNGAAGCSDGAHDNIEYPRLLWELTDASASPLGQTWSRPVVGRIETLVSSAPALANNPHPCVADNTRTCVDHYVAIFGGGFDPSLGNTLGTAIYVVDVETAHVLFKGTTGTRSGSGPAVSFGSIPADVAAVDLNDDGYLDRLYVGDLEGQLWKVDLTPDTTGATSRGEESSGSVTYLPFEIFDATASEPFYMEPTAVLVSVDAAGGKTVGIALGSGNRADLLDNTSNPQRFYFVVDPPGNATTLTLSDLADASSGATSSHGWFFPFPDPTEKTTTTALSEAGTLLFTTFRVTANNQCAADGLSRLYGLGYATGAPPAGQPASQELGPGAALGISGSVSEGGAIITIIQEQGGALQLEQAGQTIHTSIRNWKEQ